MSGQDIPPPPILITWACFQGCALRIFPCRSKEKVRLKGQPSTARAQPTLCSNRKKNLLFKFVSQDD